MRHEYFRGADGELRLYWHAQNLTEDYGNRGSIWRSGRAWLHILTRLVIGLEWVFGRRSSNCGVSLAVDDDGPTLHAHIGVPFAALFWQLEHPIVRRLMPSRLVNSVGRLGETFRIYDERELSLKVHSGSVWWSLWMSGNEWRRTDPKWRRGSFNPLTFLFGRHKYTSETIEERAVAVPLPEWAYAGSARLHRDTWKRPRLWWASKSLLRVTLDVEGGVPIPGKGENSYDCDDDAIYGSTVAARTIEDGIGELVASALRTRRKYGGEGWVPRDGWKVPA